MSLGVRPEVETSSNMQINTNEKHTSPISMKNAKYPPKINITYDVTNRVKSQSNIPGVMYGQK